MMHTTASDPSRRWPIHPRLVVLLVTNAVGIAVFLWPFFVGSSPGTGQLTAIVMGTAAALLTIETLTRRLNARSLALLAALAALDAGARAALVTGIGGFSPIFLLILCGGYVFGAEYGFLLGVVSLLVSALVTGGLGPWLPYQLFATGWVGLGAGLVGMRRQARPSRRDVIVLAVVGALSGYGFGIAMDLWNWAFFSSSPALGFHAGMSLSVALSHFLHYYLVTSLLYDTFRAAGNAVMVLAIGLPIITALARIRTRLRVEVETISTAPRTISPSP